MRLIDADEPKKVFEDLANDEWNKTTSTSWSRAFEESADIIDGCKTIEERKRGEWEQVHNDGNGIDFRCSVCHRYRFHNGEMLRKYKFCPNCGAKMEV